MCSVFIVTTGEYSDLAIRAVYSDESAAQAHAALFEPYDDAAVSEFPLDAPYPARVVDVVKVGGVISLPDGEIDPLPSLEARGMVVQEPAGFVNVTINVTRGVRIVINVSGENEADVNKVWSERRAHALAEVDLLGGLAYADLDPRPQ